MRARAGLVFLLAVGACVLAPVALGQASFYVSITSASAPSYSRTLDVMAWAGYRDPACRSAMRCDRNVVGEFELRRGSSSFGPLVARAVDETGQTGSSLKAAFRIPSCRVLPKGRRQPYTIVLTAVAPDGQHRTTSRTVYVPSCR